MAVFGNGYSGGYGGGSTYMSSNTKALLGLGALGALALVLANQHPASAAVVSPANPMAPTTPTTPSTTSGPCPAGYTFTPFGTPYQVNNPNPNGSGVCCPNNNSGPCLNYAGTASGGNGGFSQIALCPGNAPYNGQYNSCQGNTSQLPDDDEGGINDTNT